MHKIGTLIVEKCISFYVYEDNDRNYEALSEFFVSDSLFVGGVVAQFANSDIPRFYVVQVALTDWWGVEVQCSCSCRSSIL